MQGGSHMRYNEQVMNILSTLIGKTAYAAAGPPEIPASAKTFIGKISTEILDPIIAIMFALATMYFFYGVAAYIWNPDNEEVREKGKIGMLYGLIGMFIMVAVFGILKFIISSTGSSDQVLNFV